MFACDSQGLVNAAIEDGVENIFFAFEVEIDGAVGDAGLARDIGDFGIELAVMGEDGDNGAQDGFAFIAAGAGKIAVESSGRTHRE